MRKPQSQPALATLTTAEREQLADWLRREKYDVVLERVKTPRPEGFGLNLKSKKPLRTFHAKVAFLDLINARLPQDNQLTLAQFETLTRRDIHLLTSAENKKLHEAHQSILNTTADLATSGDNTPAQLLTLQRLADFPARAEIRANKETRAQEMHAHKITLDLRKQTHKEQTTERHLQLAECNTTLREKTLAHRIQESARRADSKLKTKNSKLSPEDLARGITHYDDQGRPCDDLGPFASNPEELRARVRKKFGITPEESARRAALFHKLYNPDGTLKTPAPHSADLNLSLNLNPNLPSDSHTAAPADPRAKPSPGGTSSPSPTSTSRDALDSTCAAPADLNVEPNPFPSHPEDLAQNTSSEIHNSKFIIPNSDPASSALTSIASESTEPAAGSPAPNSKLNTKNSKLAAQAATLAERVNTYTIRRAREYIAHNQRHTPWPYRHSPPKYVTEFRHCPCGHGALSTLTDATQHPSLSPESTHHSSLMTHHLKRCPIHESEEFGPFPEIFWSLSPLSGDYANCLEERNLPFRFPTEFLP